MSGAIWNSISSQSDIENLLKIFSYFHDTCLHEAHIWTEHWVSPDLSMHCSGELDTRIRLLVQRQLKNPSAVELSFEQVVTFHLQPSPQNCDSIILGATMLLDNGIFYWADTIGWKYTADSRDSSTWIAARKIAWRDVSDWMGADLRYGSADAGR
jgi:hypothetical protein